MESADSIEVVDRVTITGVNEPVVPVVIRSLGTVLGIDVWSITLNEVAGDGDLEVGVLSPAEHARAQRFVFERDRRRYVAAHVVLRQLLAIRTGERPALLRFEDGPHGKPRLCGGACAFSLSHSAQHVLIAISDADDIGADLELVKSIPDAERLAQELYSPAERMEIAAAENGQRAFLSCWTRKEACLKAIGHGLSIEPRGFEAGAAPGQRTLSISIDRRPVVVTVASVDAGADCVAAVARLVPTAD